MSPPILPEVIRRQRLYKRLEGGFRGRVTWVGGPVGSGKTTLVAKFLADSDLQRLWFRVDEEDNDPASVFRWLSAAVQRMGRDGARSDLPVFGPEKLSGLSSFARTFLRSLDEQLPPGCVLVFDNVQDVNDEAFFYQFTQRLAHELTPDKHVVLISRSDPHRLFATFTAARELTFLNWSDLRFTDDEARSLVALLLGTRDDTYADHLQAVADGWAAGLTLLAQRAPPAGHGDGSAATAVHRLPTVIFDYVATELFESLDEGLQQFLLRTAFTPTLTPSTAQSLSGRNDAEDILTSLHRKNYFTARRDGRPPEFEYHPLFRQFLMQYAQTKKPLEEIANLKRTTAELLEATGSMEAAMDLYVDLADWPSIERLLCRHGFALIEQARNQTIARWLRNSPADVLASRPWLRYWTGVAQMVSSVPGAIATLTESYHAFRRSGEREASFVAWVTAVELLANINCYSADLDFWLEEMDAVRAVGTTPTSDELACRVAIAMVGANEYRRPWHPDCAYWRHEALALAKKIGRQDFLYRAYLFAQ